MMNNLHVKKRKKKSYKKKKTETRETTRTALVVLGIKDGGWKVKEKGISSKGRGNLKTNRIPRV